MKKFCECNSEWIVRSFDSAADIVDQLVCGLTFEGSQWCPQCRFYKWYNPQYENMMYDLKSMNS